MAFRLDVEACGEAEPVSFSVCVTASDSTWSWSTGATHSAATPASRLPLPKLRQGSVSALASFQPRASRPTSFVASTAFTFAPSQHLKQGTCWRDLLRP